LPWPGL